VCCCTHGAGRFTVEDLYKPDTISLYVMMPMGLKDQYILFEKKFIIQSDPYAAK
jgi:hypothetical protein